MSEEGPNVDPEELPDAVGVQMPVGGADPVSVVLAAVSVFAFCFHVGVMLL